MSSIPSCQWQTFRRGNFQCSKLMMWSSGWIMCLTRRKCSKPGELIHIWNCNRLQMRPIRPLTPGANYKTEQLYWMQPSAMNKAVQVPLWHMEQKSHHSSPSTHLLLEPIRTLSTARTAGNKSRTSSFIARTSTCSLPIPASSRARPPRQANLPITTVAVHQLVSLVILH